VPVNRQPDNLLVQHKGRYDTANFLSFSKGCAVIW
jgi:hypothetical protein